MMDRTEKSTLIIELTRHRVEEQRRFDALLEKLDSITRTQSELSAEAAKLRVQISKLTVLLSEKEAETSKLLNRIKDLEDQSNFNNKKTYSKVALTDAIRERSK